MGKRVLPLQDKSGSFLGWLIECPGCRSAHLLDPRRSFNGDEERPTFHVSLLVNSQCLPGHPRCHSYITNGKIQFLSDSTHDKVGLTMDLPEFYVGDR